MMLEKVNEDFATIIESATVSEHAQLPIMATPAAFLAGVVVGGKVTAVLIGAVGAGVAIGKAIAS